jgi:hypothetical protein
VVVVSLQFLPYDRRAGVAWSRTTTPCFTPNGYSSQTWKSALGSQPPRASFQAASCTRRRVTPRREGILCNHSVQKAVGYHSGRPL